MNRHIFTPTETEYIKREFPKRKTQDIANELNLKYYQVAGHANRQGLKKTPEYMATQGGRTNGKRGVSTRFKKGHVPANKGKKMPPELLEKVSSTWYKKGHQPHNTKYNGYERISKDGYIERRISKGVFKAVHRIVWEKVNGPVPQNHIVVFKDRNKLNSNIENLECISYEQNMKRNSIVRYPSDVISIIKLNHKLKKKINDGTKQA